MQLVLSKYLVDLRTVKNVTYESISQYPEVVVSDRPVNESCYMLSWGMPVYGAKNGVIETGFFWNAIHIDTLGIYKNSSFNTVLGWKEVETFNAPKSASAIVLNGKHTSKYSQVNVDVEWDGVVLASQNPRDRSVHSIGSTEDYYKFVRGACEHYGERLFIKLHPWSSGEGVMERMTQYANEFGCQMAKTNHSVLKNCEFVIVWNSSFSVDCFIRNIPVVQFAPGYWHSTPAVKYSAYTYPDKPGDTIQAGQKLADFLIWKYCFNMHQPIEQWIKLIHHYADSRELFPLPEEFCYANNLDWT